MSRKIKFRAWDIKNKRFVNIVRLIFDQFGTLDYAEVVFKGKIYKLYPSEIILEQDTGLKDKNGEKIVEGDIIDDGFSHIGKVFFNQIISAFVFEFVVDDNIVGSTFVDLYTRDIEVIGNIHENTQLLGGKNG